MRLSVHLFSFFFFKGRSNIVSWGVITKSTNLRKGGSASNGGSFGSVCWSLAKKLILLFAVAGVALNVWTLRRLRDQLKRDAEIDKQLAHDGLRGLQSEDGDDGESGMGVKKRSKSGKLNQVLNILDLVLKAEEP